MSDLFAAAPIDRTVPAYGSLSPGEEFHLYSTDRRAWVHYVVPHYVELMSERAWAEWVWPQLPRDIQVAIWEALPEETRLVVRNLRARASTHHSAGSAPSSSP